MPLERSGVLLHYHLPPEHLELNLQVLLDSVLQQVLLDSALQQNQRLALAQLNLQLASPTAVVVSFATFDDPDAMLQPPAVQLRLASESAAREAAPAVKTVRGVTHVYSMNGTGHSPITNKTYYLHFVRLSDLRERTAYSYRARSGGGGNWSPWRRFTSLYSTGETRLALFGDMGNNRITL